MAPVAVRYLADIESELQKNVQTILPSAQSMYDMIAYSLGWKDEHGELLDDQRRRGKRFRSILALLICEAISGDYRLALPFAATIELFHNFTLIHDDIEDHDQFRRHQPSLWKLFGPEQANNAGDALYTLALRPTLQSGHAKTIQFIGLMNDAWLRIVEGQHLDLKFESEVDVTVEQYLEMIEAKTAVLVGLSAEIGATVATDDQRIIDSYRKFGLNFGLAYQVFDDIDSVWGETDATGKAVGGDIKKKKKTLPFIYAMGKLGQTDRQKLLKLYQKKSIGPNDVQKVIALFDKVEAKGFCHQVGESYKTQALSSLAATSVNNDRQEEIRSLIKTIVA